MEQREIFIKKAEKFGFYPETTGYIYDKTIIPAANYSFNKSHAACYAFIAYQGAYLKNKYPAEYTTAILITQGEILPRVKVAIEDALLDGISIEPLDINKSNIEYEYVDDKHIRMGLKTIKGVGIKSLEKIIDDRTKNGIYNTFDDFVIRNKENIDSKVLTGLLQSGALDNLIEQEKGLYNIKRILNFIKKSKKDKTTSNQVNMFDLFTEETPDSKLVDLEEPLKASTPDSKAKNEIEVLGLMVKNHPFDHVKSFIEKLEYNRELLHLNKSIHYLKNSKNKQIRGLAIISDLTVNTTKDGKHKLSLKLLGTDYFINASIKESLYHEFESILVGKDKKKPIGIGKMIEFKGNYYLFQGHRGVSIETIEIKDIDKMYQVAKNKGVYNLEEKCSWEDIYKYKNAKIDDKIPVVISFSDYLLEKEKRNTLIEKMNRIKDYLIKNTSEDKNMHVLLKDNNGNLIADTKMYVDNKSIIGLFNLVKRESGLKINVSHDKETGDYKLY